jgi:hypothetical protein
VSRRVSPCVSDLENNFLAGGGGGLVHLCSDISADGHKKWPKQMQVRENIGFKNHSSCYKEGKLTFITNSWNV